MHSVLQVMDLAIIRFQLKLTNFASIDNGGIFKKFNLVK